MKKTYLFSLILALAILFIGTGVQAVTPADGATGVFPIVTFSTEFTCGGWYDVVCLRIQGQQNYDCSYKLYKPYNSPNPQSVEQYIYQLFPNTAYEWYAVYFFSPYVPVKPGGSSVCGYSSTYKFTTANSPVVAALESPANGATVDKENANFSWQNIGANYYYFYYYYDVEEGAPNIRRITTTKDITSLTIPFADLLYGRPYKWYVYACNKNIEGSPLHKDGFPLPEAECGPRSEERTFTTSVMPAPGKPTLVSPINDIEVSSLLPAFRCEPTGLSGGETEYSFYVRKKDGGNNFTSLPSILGNCFLNLTNYQAYILTANANYEWYVRACNGGNCSTDSDYGYFKTPQAGAPTVISISPSGADIPIPVQFSWSFPGAAPTQSTALYYRKEGTVSWTDAPLAKTATSYSLASASFDTTYEWYVRVCNTGSLCYDSSIMEFTTIAEASPGLTSCSAQGGTCCGAGKNCTGPTYNTNGSDCPTAECCQNATNCPAGPGPEPDPGPEPGPEPNIGQCLDSTIDTANLKTYQVGDREVAYDGLVPCGKCVLVGDPGVDVVDENGDWVGDATATNVPCQLCHFFIMIKGVSDFIFFQLVPVVAVLLFTVGGIMYIVAKGDPSKLTQAKSIMTAVIFGLVIVFASWLVINTIFVFTGLINPDFGWDPSKWFEINCSIVLPAP